MKADGLSVTFEVRRKSEENNHSKVEEKKKQPR